MPVQGTNGGVTVLGLIASVMGGLFMGFISYIVGMVSPSIFTRAVLFEAASAQWQLIPLGGLLLCCRCCLDCLASCRISRILCHLRCRWSTQQFDLIACTETAHFLSSPRCQKGNALVRMELCSLEC